MYELSPIGAAEVDGCGKSAPPRHGGDEAQLQATEVVHGQLEELHARVVVFQVLRVRCASKRAQNTATRQQCYAAATQFGVHIVYDTTTVPTQRVAKQLPGQVMHPGRTTRTIRIRTCSAQ